MGDPPGGEKEEGRGGERRGEELRGVETRRGKRLAEYRKKLIIKKIKRTRKVERQAIKQRRGD